MQAFKQLLTATLDRVLARRFGLDRLKQDQPELIGQLRELGKLNIG